jgi:hypothetical protein
VEFQTRKSCGCSGHAADEPNELFHACFPSAPIIHQTEGWGRKGGEGCADVAGSYAREAGWQTRGGGLDDGVVVGPGGFEAVGEFFYRLDAIAIPDEEAYECCCQDR